jgi:hypothetical protein
MKQKQHSINAIIRILRQSEGDEIVESISLEHNIHLGCEYSITNKAIRACLAESTPKSILVVVLAEFGDHYSFFTLV